MTGAPSKHADAEFEDMKKVYIKGVEWRAQIAKYKKWKGPPVEIYLLLLIDAVGSVSFIKAKEDSAVKRTMHPKDLVFERMHEPDFAMWGEKLNAIGSHVKHFRHALSLDTPLWEHRPTRMVPPTKEDAQLQTKDDEAPSFKQVWFGGFHNDCCKGSTGNPEDLGWITLAWLVSSANQLKHSVKFDLRLFHEWFEACLPRKDQSEDPNGQPHLPSDDWIRWKWGEPVHFGPSAKPKSKIWLDSKLHWRPDFFTIGTGHDFIHCSALTPCQQKLRGDPHVLTVLLEKYPAVVLALTPLEVEVKECWTQRFSRIRFDPAKEGRAWCSIFEPRPRAPQLHSDRSIGTSQVLRRQNGDEAGWVRYRQRRDGARERVSS